MSKKYYFQKTLVVIWITLMANNHLFAQFSGGTGSAANPYQIATIADLQAMDNFGTSWKHYKFTADIDMNGQSFVAIRTNNTQAFQGYIDGDNHIISNLTINTNGNAAGRTGFVRKLQGTIENLGFFNITVNGSSYAKTGAVAGEIQDNANYFIKNCYVKNGSVTGDDFVGGLVGVAYSNNIIENCYADVLVSGTGLKVGGIAGRSSGTIKTCVFYNNASSTIASNWGYPIALLHSNALTVTNCYYNAIIFTGSQTNTGAQGRNTAQLTHQSNYQGFDFSTPIWSMSTSFGHAVLDKFANLPVELTTFTGENIGSSNLLNWQTASETSNSHFEIERSKDGITFEKTGTVIGNGTTSEISNYQFEDRNPFAINYYRLRQVDLPTGQAGFDEKFEYSKIIVIRNEIQNKTIRIFPIPFSKNLTVEYKSSFIENITLSLMDITGKIILTQKSTSQIGYNSFNIDSSNLPHGTYYVRLMSKNINLIKTIIK